MSEAVTTERIDALKSRALEALASTSDPPALDEWRIAYLGRRGELTQLLRGLGSLPAEERPRIGAAANAVRAILQEALTEREDALKRVEAQAAGPATAIDVTLPGWPIPRGGLHPTTRVVREICAAFGSMGFSVVEGPEIEWDHYNFEMLNIPEGPPGKGHVEHLSGSTTQNDRWRACPCYCARKHRPCKSGSWRATEPPVRVVVPGKCYRYEATDATHEWHFFQIEGSGRGPGHHP